MIWIVYRTTCKINGKFYIGVHKTETDEIFDWNETENFGESREMSVC